MKYSAQLLLGIATIFLLQGCSSGASSLELTPEEIQRAVKKFNGYEELKRPAQAKKVKLIFRGAGEKDPVNFSFSFALSTSTEWCKELEGIGSTVDANLPVASSRFSQFVRFNEQNLPGFLVKEIDAPESETVQVQGIAHTFNNYGGCATPHRYTLIVKPSHTYLVTFVWSDRSCGLRLEDVTNNVDAPIPAYYRNDTPHANTWSGFAKCPWGENP